MENLDTAQVRSTTQPAAASQSNSEPVTLAELQASIDARRTAAESEHGRIADDIKHRKRLAEISRDMPAMTTEQIAARDAEIVERDRMRDLAARHDRLRAFIFERGERYSDCRLGTFEKSTPGQVKVVDDLTDYLLNIETRVESGEGILFVGPRGTGKDHLAVAMVRATILSGFSVLWQNGMDLWGDVRDRMDSGDSERALVRRLVAPDVLYLSDPVPPMGKLTEFQAAMLFRVLDGRYSRRRPTWVTLNVASGQEADERMGPQNGDRLRDGALVISCNWGSYRRVRP